MTPSPIPGFFNNTNDTKTPVFGKANQIFNTNNSTTGNNPSKSFSFIFAFIFLKNLIKNLLLLFKTTKNPKF
jgi:hypothetical protein